MHGYTLGIVLYQLYTPLKHLNKDAVFFAER